MRQSYKLLIIFFSGISLCSSCISDNVHKKFFYQEIYFDFPGSWNVEVDEIPGISYYVSARESKNTFLAVLTDKNMDAGNMIDAYYAENRMDTTTFLLSTGAVVPGKFGKYDALTSNFTRRYRNRDIYGAVYAFNYEKKHILIVKMSDSKDLGKSFGTIEKSFDIETKP
jgi:hypothetical protein